MQFPHIESGEVYTDPLQGYINFFANHDTYGKLHNRTDKLLNASGSRLEKASRLIGQGCLSLALQNNSHRAKVRFRHAKTEIKSALQEAPKRFSQEKHRAKMALHVAQIVDMRNQPSFLSHEREDLHATVIDGLRQSRQQFRKAANGRKTEMKGYITEMTALGLLTRYNHPWILALPALEHHDRSDSPETNFDMLLVEGGPGVEAPLTYKIQVKNECLDFCKDASSAKPKIIDRYANDIVLVSGCCDLGFGHHGEPDHTTVSMLTAEFNETAPAETITALDHLTNRLLFAITSEDRRHGSQAILI